jgi:RND family efflux transporter MFP subunit
MRQGRRLAAAAATTTMLLVGCGRESSAPPPPPAVRPVKIHVVGSLQAEGAPASVRSFPGSVQATDRVELSFRVGGPLVELPVREGDEVEQGRLLARIDPRDFRLAVASAQARFDKAESDFRRAALLYEKDAISEAELDQYQAARDIAAAGLEDARAALSDTRLRAPFGATIGAIFVDNFQEVSAKQPVISLVDVTRLDVVVDLPETLVARGDRSRDLPELHATFEAAPDRRFPLELKEVAAQADPRTQTYRVTLTMPQPEGLLVLPGMTATVHARQTGGRATRLVVPAISVTSAGSGESHVWVLGDDGTLRRRPVRVGSLAGTDRIEILGGLERGERIAVSAVSHLDEGMAVRPMGE